jgi:hypothetical protein
VRQAGALGRMRRYQRCLACPYSHETHGAIGSSARQGDSVAHRVIEQVEEPVAGAGYEPKPSQSENYL